MNNIRIEKLRDIESMGIDIEKKWVEEGLKRSLGVKRIAKKVSVGDGVVRQCLRGTLWHSRVDKEFRRITGRGKPDWEVVERVCLKCRKVFKSYWVGNRMCRHCR